MKENQLNLHYPTNWSIRFLCDCRKQSKTLNIHNGVAQELSTRGVRILSDHHICQHKKIAMQLTVPPLLNGAPQKIVKIIGHSIATIMKEGQFITEIEFRHFEEDGQKVLEKNLHERFDQYFFAQVARNA